MGTRFMAWLPSLSDINCSGSLIHKYSFHHAGWEELTVLLGNMAPLPYVHVVPAGIFAGTKLNNIFLVPVLTASALLIR